MTSSACARSPASSRADAASGFFRRPVLQHFDLLQGDLVALFFAAADVAEGGGFALLEQDDANDEDEEAEKVKFLLKV